MKPHQGQKLLQKGPKLSDAKAALILIHGRGSAAEEIMSLAGYFQFDGMTFLAPQAAGNTWYPLSFLAPVHQNEPGISSGIIVIKNLIEELENKGIAKNRIFLAGFSQGACLSLEFGARNAQKMGGIFAFSGGLIGPQGIKRNYSGNFVSTPVFLGCSDNDPHIPLWRVKETNKIYTNLKANVTEKIYHDMGHTINEDEIAIVNNIISDKLAE